MKITFHRQETWYSCLPACLRMVLSGFGVEISEGQLREDCDTTFLGTDALIAVDAARRLGFEHSDKQTLNYEELRTCVETGLRPIVFVSALPIDAVPDIHAVVVIDATDDHVQILDPSQGERQLPRSVFNSAWEMAYNLTIRIQR